jgi:hypothetical protein
MKDLNWEKKGRKLALGPRKRRLFIQQLVLDVKVRFNLVHTFLQYIKNES